jgi:hypothetical protein
MAAASEPALAKPDAGPLTCPTVVVRQRAYSRAMDADTRVGWAPDACTLSPDERLARAQEFGRLFAETVRKAERPDLTRLRLELAPGPDTAARVAALAAAETACCSFFTFTLTVAAGSLALDVEVPAAQRDVLDALAEHAAASIKPA